MTCTGPLSVLNVTINGLSNTNLAFVFEAPVQRYLFILHRCTLRLLTLKNVHLAVALIVIASR